jgi:chloramphenicol 3-O phosphotransferase
LKTTARVVLLNGAGSVGKSSIARALQTMTSEPFLHVQLDAFLDMLPAVYQDHPDAFSYESAIEDGKPIVVIKGGPVGDRVIRGMRHAIAAMASQGNNLIVDDVMLDNARAGYASLLSAFPVYTVGLFAPLDVLEARERARGDRLIGLARWQYDRVHSGMSYDLEIDTSTTAPEDGARMVKERFRL